MFPLVCLGVYVEAFLGFSPCQIGSAGVPAFEIVSDVRPLLNLER